MLAFTRNDWGQSFYNGKPRFAASFCFTALPFGAFEWNKTEYDESLVNPNLLTAQPSGPRQLNFRVNA